MKYKWDKKYLYWGVTAFLVIAASILISRVMPSWEIIMGWGDSMLNGIIPLVFGMVFAYILFPLTNFYEKKVFCKLMKPKNPRTPRYVAVACALATAVAFVTILLFMIVPQLYQSAERVVTRTPAYLENGAKWFEGFLDDELPFGGFAREMYENAVQYASSWLQTDVMPYFSTVVTNLTSGIAGVISTMINISLGLIVSIYILSGREKLNARVRKLSNAVFGSNITRKTAEVLMVAHKTFGGYLSGMALDSIIIGMACFIGLSILQVPYALLVSVIVGVTNIIPFFGPFIGGIPSGFLILMESPIKCLVFVIFIVVLQQIDGNLLKPRIVSHTTGLDGLFVMMSILFFGELWGIVGMLIGVPVFMVIYMLVKSFCEKRLRAKNLPEETQAYFNSGEDTAAESGEKA
ncbi:MAG: AI-2E family transporter [Clostridia bacterium]|nr:AI-2E family transporter [Clostridia bacterium]